MCPSKTDLYFVLPESISVLTETIDIHSHWHLHKLALSGKPFLLKFPLWARLERLGSERPEPMTNDHALRRSVTGSVVEAHTVMSASRFPDRPREGVVAI